MFISKKKLGCPGYEGYPGHEGCPGYEGYPGHEGCPGYKGYSIYTGCDGCLWYNDIQEGSTTISKKINIRGIT